MITMQHMADQGDKIEIFTDGSKNDEGRVGGAFFVKQTNTLIKFRITDKSTIFNAELMAIKKAIEHIKLTHSKEVIIYTDSLSATQAIESGFSKSNPKLLKQVQNSITEIIREGTKLEIHWIPSHVGISGNDIADNLAKTSLNHPEIGEEIEPQSQDIYKHIDEIIKEKWQILWNQETTGRHYHEIQPMVDNKIKYSDRKCRLKETLLTRMRLGRCYLKHYLFQMNIGTDGQCTTCNKKQTIKHWILECGDNRELEESIRKICQKASIPLDISSILKNFECLDEVYKHARNTNAKI